MIELKDLKKVFGSKEEQIHAVNGVTLTIHDGEIFGIIGFSGAGILIGFLGGFISITKYLKKEGGEILGW